MELREQTGPPPQNTFIPGFPECMWTLRSHPRVFITTSSLLVSASGIPPRIQRDLGHLLSPNARIVLPGSPQFAKLAARWQDGGRPNYGVIVVPATSKDVSESVKYANAHDIPFLAQSGGHGSWYGMSKLQHGMGIWMHNLSKVEVSRDGQSATLGGGLYVDDVIRELWAAGKQTTTGTCNCVGAVSPGLGGGHGFLQGQVGLAADQILSAQVVLADGRLVTVSDRSNQDLYWGLRGAGHNFGIVTEMRYKVYDAAAKPVWSYEFFTFRGDQLEALYRLTSRMMRYQPAEVIHWSRWFKNTTVDPVNAIIQYSITFNGPIAALNAYTRPIHALNPLDSVAGSTDYPGLAVVNGYTVDGYLCAHKGAVSLYPIVVDDYDVQATRKMYDLYNAMLRRVDAFAAGSFVLLEGYSWQAMQAVAAESTAYPHRDQRLLISPLINFADVQNQTLAALAVYWGEAMRTAGFGRNKRRSYVNYAKGTESPQSMYGYEPWRLRKLRELKRKYDPTEQFGFFAPIE
ncbi:hypothetical protein B0T22DRAFT_502533 [Podospora appendiculata]|uniref:FAD-binding PCMH-type domain-containing protein n=1 Tax=Podospora appendiculata TaxID=314037 RepID=A0AAE1C724_9PEZI|nr:hypothetical protein B0T22DRAFT_502533 [Podospora appendiculata]